MKKRFDKDDVLRFLYNEMDESEQTEFLDALSEDEDLWHMYQECQEAINILGEPSYEPSEYSCDKIMTFAKEAVLPERRAAFSFSKIFRFQTVVTACFTLITIITVTVTLFAYQHTIETDQDKIMQSMNWDASHLDQRIKMMRYNVSNLSSQRQVPLHVNHNIYKMVSSPENTRPQQSVVLVKLP